MIEPKLIEVVGSSSPLSFARPNREIGGDMMRRLLVAGTPAFEIGIDCDSHGFMFTRLDGAQGFEQVDFPRDVLSAGITSLDEVAVTAASKALPDGRYQAFLTAIQPKLVRPGSEEDYFRRQFVDSGFGEHDPMTLYYRGSDYRFAPASSSYIETAMLFECLVPALALENMNPDRVAEGKAQVVGGSTPTAIAVSVLDVAALGDWGTGRVADVYEHWGLVHYLLDGHHKTRAAAELLAENIYTPARVNLLWFLSLDHSMATDADVQRLAELLDKRY